MIVWVALVSAVLDEKFEGFGNYNRIVAYEGGIVLYDWATATASGVADLFELTSPPKSNAQVCVKLIRSLALWAFIHYSVVLSGDLLL